jgi:fumarate hydratase subunit beta
MDVYTPDFLDRGLCAMIGKGKRSRDVCDAIIRNGAVYFCSIGGAGALAAMCISSCEVIAFDELGCESVKKLELSDFPVYVAIDCKGGTLFKD